MRGRPFRSQHARLAESVGVQVNGQGDTIEQISIDLSGTAAKIVVDVQGTSSAVGAPTLDLRWRRMNAEADGTTRAGSLNPDSNYTGLATSDTIGDRHPPQLGRAFRRRRS